MAAETDPSCVGQSALFWTIFLCLLIIIPPAEAHVPLMATGNSAVSAATVIDSPAKTYAMYGILERPGDAAYFRFLLNTGDQIDLSLMNSGPLHPVPDMVILSPGVTDSEGALPADIEIPAGYTAHRVNGSAPQTAEYDPFAPAAIYKVASYSSVARAPGYYYVVIFSNEEDTHYTLVTGTREGFSVPEWVLTPVSAVATHIWEEQPLLTVLAPCLAVVILSLILVARREQRKGSRPGPVFWFTTIAGIVYIGGAALTAIQMFRVVRITGIQPSLAVTLIVIIVPAGLGWILLTIARKPSRASWKNRTAIFIVGVIGLFAWAGLIAGPACAMIAALLPAGPKDT